MAEEELRKKKALIEEEIKELQEQVRLIDEFSEKMKEYSELQEKLKEYEPLIKRRDKLRKEIRSIGMKVGGSKFVHRLIEQLELAYPEKMEVLRKGRKAELSYEMVTEAADSIMNEGWGVTIALLLERLGLPGSRRKELSNFLEKAVVEGKYEKRPLDFRAYHYLIYSPKGKKLPLLPKTIKPKMMKMLGSDIEDFVGKEERFTYNDISSPLRHYRKEFNVRIGELRACIYLWLLYLEEIGKLRSKREDNRTIYESVKGP